MQSILRTSAVGRSIPNLISQLDEYAFQKPTSQEGIENAITLCRELLNREQLDGHYCRVVRLNLGAYLARKHRITGDIADLEEASRVGLEAATSIPEDDETKLPALFNLLQILVEKHKVTTTTGALEDLLEIRRQVYQGLPLDDPDRPLIGENLRIDLTEMFNRTKEIEFLKEAISVARTLTGQDCASSMRDLLSQKYSRTSNLADLEDAILYSQRVVQELDSDSARLPGAANNLAILMSERYSHLDLLSDLERAIRLSRQAMASDDPERVTISFNLSVMLRKRYERRGYSKDLTEALKFSKIAIDSPHIGHPERARWFCNHAQCLIHRYWESPSLEILDEAIDYCDKAVQEPSPGYLDRVTARIHLSTVLMTRFERSGTTEDLQDAEKHSQEAIYEMDKERFMDAQSLNTFATMLGRKYHREKGVQDLDRAIIFARKAVDAEPPGHANRRRSMGNLASWLADRYEEQKDRADITEAMEISHQILETVPEDHIDRLGFLSNHVRYLLQRKEPNDIEEAICISRNTITEATAEDPVLSIMRKHLGWALQTRLRSKTKEDGQADLNEAIYHFSILAQDEGSNPLIRVQCAESAAILLTNKPEWLAAYELIASAVKLLPTVGIRGLSWDDRQFLMRKLSNTSSLAASLALQAHQSASTALGLQEAGRGVIAATVIDSRSDLSDLEAASPTLYEKYMERRAATTFQLSQNERKPSDGLTTRSRSIRLLEDLEKRIRETTDLKSFGLPLAPIEIMRLAGLGHIVSFNVSEYRSDAFLVTQNSIEILRLPDLNYDVLHKFVQELPHLTKVHNENDPGDTLERNIALGKSLKWLWDVAVQPVLHALNLMDASIRRDPLPRLWWVMSGLAGQIPLHAAGEEWGKGVNNTANHVISSYIPTFKILASAREKSLLTKKQKSFGVQVVAMPKSTRLGNLMFRELSTGKEIDAIRMGIEAQDGDIDVLETPTKAEVINALPNRPAIHFACHGISDPLNPSNSSLLLAKGELLTVRELADVSLPQARIAYLSACSTAQHGSDDLRDEVLHVASAFQLIGFPHVLGTLWEAGDGAAVRMAGLFYQELASQMNMEEGGKGKYTDGQVALAHCRAVEKLWYGVGGRNIANDVIKWATFVHLGC